jgi:hypothetical protein
MNSYNRASIPNNILPTNNLNFNHHQATIRTNERTHWFNSESQRNNSVLFNEPPLNILIIGKLIIWQTVSRHFLID